MFRCLREHTPQTTIYLFTFHYSIIHFRLRQPPAPRLCLRLHLRRRATRSLYLITSMAIQRLRYQSEIVRSTSVHLPRPPVASPRARVRYLVRQLLVMSISLIHQQRSTSFTFTFWPAKICQEEKGELLIFTKAAKAHPFVAFWSFRFFVLPKECFQPSYTKWAAFNT